MANATVGDRPQIEEDEDSDEERERLNDNGKQLRKALRKRGELDDIFGSEDEVSKQYKARDTLADNQDSDSDAESVKTEKSTEKKKEERPVPGSAERPSRPTSLPGVPGRRTSSPAHRRPHAPSKDKAQTAPPGAGAALLAQRAATGLASPRHKRTASPHASSGRGQSPGSVPRRKPCSRRCEDDIASIEAGTEEEVGYSFSWTLRWKLDTWDTFIYHCFKLETAIRTV
jgi:transcription initiation factor TFIIF subunit alpha